MMAILMSDVWLDDAARYVVGVAEQLKATEDDMSVATRNLVWEGPAADRFISHVTSDRLRLEDTAHELLWVGHLLRAAAIDIRAEQTVLNRSRLEVELYLDRQTDPLGALRALGWTGPGLPSADDTAWKEMAGRIPASEAGIPVTGGVGL